MCLFFSPPECDVVFGQSNRGRTRLRMSEPGVKQRRGGIFKAQLEDGAESVRGSVNSFRDGTECARARACVCVCVCVCVREREGERECQGIVAVFAFTDMVRHPACYSGAQTRKAIIAADWVYTSIHVHTHGRVTSAYTAGL